MSNYPGALDTTADLLVARNSFRTYLTGAIAPGTTSIPLNSVTGLQATDGVVSIGSEVIKYASISGTTLLGCTRGFDNTTAASHSLNDDVELRFVAQHHNGLASAVLALQAELGTDPSDDLNSVAFSSVKERLDNTLPLVTPKTSNTVWTVNHSRKRICSVECWTLVSGSDYEKTVPTSIVQNLNLAGVSTVTVTFATAKSGYLVLI